MKAKLFISGEFSYMSITGMVEIFQKEVAN